MGRRRKTTIPLDWTKALAAAELGYPYRVIAEVQRVPVGTICSRIYKARQRVAEYGPAALSDEKTSNA